MTQPTTPFYRSANGDRWTLIHEEPGGRQMVRHEANEASGGHVTETEVAEFLSIGGAGAEFAALRAVLQKQSDAISAQV